MFSLAYLLVGESESLGASSALSSGHKHYGRLTIRVPLPVADYFASMVSKGEKSSAIRDYGLFTAGVVVSEIVGIVLKHFGWA